MNPDNLHALDLLLWALATFRVSLMVSKEDGPYWVFAKLRRLPPPKSSTRQGLSCILCVSVWASALILGLELSGQWWAGLIILWLAVSGAAIVINQAFTKDV